MRSSGLPLCAEVRLCITLRYLSGGQVWDIRSNFGVGTSEFLSISRCVVDALNEKFTIDLDLTGKRRLEKLEQPFAEKSRFHTLQGAVGAIVGCLIWQNPPAMW